MQDRVFVDSNIFLYAFSDLDMEKQKIASEIVSQANCVISSQVLNEVSNNLIKKLSFNNSEISRFIESAYSRYWVAGVGEDTFLKACELRESYKFSYYDSLIVASASLEGCQRLYSEDMQHGLVLSNQMMIVNPFIKT